MNLRRRLARLLLGRPFFTLDGRDASEAWLVTRSGQSIIGLPIKEWDTEFTDTIEVRPFDLYNTTYRPGRKHTFSGTFS